SKIKFQLKKKDNTKKIRINDTFELSLNRLVHNDHLPEYKDKRDTCLWY
ncbi:21808_t:CDS:1, partial [Cetraspora pellucida]